MKGLERTLGLPYVVAISIGAMLGSGIVAAYKGSGVINFAHGAVAMYGAYTWSELTLTGEVRFPWFDHMVIVVQFQLAQGMGCPSMVVAAV